MADKIILKNALIANEIKDVEIEDGKIVFIGKSVSDGEIIDIDGKILMPGLIDVHSHGCLGFDTSTDDELDKMARFMKENGTTAWLPTTMTVPFDDLRRVANIPLPKRCREKAHIFGFHLEGPYICAKYKGAQNESYIVKPNIDELASVENVKMVTVAPEVEGAIELISHFTSDKVENKLVFALGHTEGTFDICEKAFKAGAKCLTHTFNAMPPMLHREPGPIGAALVTGGYAQLISDGIHVHPAAVMALYKMFGPERTVLISDSMAPTGFRDGEYMIGGLNITVREGVARIDNGALAGSTSTLFHCVKKAIEFGIPKEDAFRMASQTPAELMGIKKGKIEVGYDADFIVLDEELNLIDTLVL